MDLARCEAVSIVSSRSLFEGIVIALTWSRPAQLVARGQYVAYGFI